MHLVDDAGQPAGDAGGVGDDADLLTGELGPSGGGQDLGAGPDRRPTAAVPRRRPSRR
jgi:hypothetical protein